MAFSYTDTPFLVIVIDGRPKSAHSTACSEQHVHGFKTRGEANDYAKQMVAPSVVAYVAEIVSGYEQQPAMPVEMALLKRE